MCKHVWTGGSGGGDRLQNKIRELQKELEAAREHVKHADDEAKKVSPELWSHLVLLLMIAIHCFVIL